MDVQRKYAGLRFLALLFIILAWIALIASIVFSVWFWFQDYTVRIMDFAAFRVPNWTGFTLSLPFGIFTFLYLFIIGNVLTLLSDLEYNTRANATAVAQLITAMEQMRGRESAQPAASAVSRTPPPPPPPPPVEEMEPTPPAQETQPVIPPTAKTSPPPTIEQEATPPDLAPTAAAEEDVTFAETPPANASPAKDDNVS